MNKFLLTLISLLSFSVLSAQDITTVEAKNQDISDNLDLEAVAYIFGEAKNLEDFEEKLNDPDERISNLDLNQDGYVDYLRVIETAVGNAHLITIQAVLGDEFYQDVATIDVEKDSRNNNRIQIIGDVYLYGDNYIIEPIYAINPIICDWFWSPFWRIWVSPWRFGCYPSYYVVWHPYSYYNYYTHIHTHCISGFHTIHYVTSRRSNACLRAQRETRRNDLEREQPRTNFTARQQSLSNKYDLDQQRGVNTGIKLTKIDTPPATGKEVKKDWKTQAEKEGKTSAVKDRKVTVPTSENAINKERSRPRTKRSYEDRPVQSEPKKERETVIQAPKKDNRDYERYESKPTPKKETQSSRQYKAPEPAPQSKPAKVNSTKQKSSPAPQKSRVVKSTKAPASKSSKKK
ncbi:MAG: hypothetical protein AB8B53_01455 [Flavobacteriales bacterium]